MPMTLLALALSNVWLSGMRSLRTGRQVAGILAGVYFLIYMVHLVAACLVACCGRMPALKSWQLRLFLDGKIA